MAQLQREEDLMFYSQASSEILTRYKDAAVELVWNDEERRQIIFPESKDCKGSLLELSVSTGKHFKSELGITYDIIQRFPCLCTRFI